MSDGVSPEIAKLGYSGIIVFALLGSAVSLVEFGGSGLLAVWVAVVLGTVALTAHLAQKGVQHSGNISEAKQ